MSILKPNDLKIIITQSLIYIYRSEENKIKDECCGFWTFINLNENNKLIISSFQKIPSETWALEWYSKKEGGFGWFPYCDKKYPLKDIEYSVILVNKDLPERGIITAEILLALKK
tara:strand:- start:36 stop:380 length:345 start_codon:yes stop_codon:yes gene_type:complete